MNQKCSRPLHCDCSCHARATTSFCGLLALFDYDDIMERSLRQAETRPCYSSPCAAAAAATVLIHRLRTCQAPQALRDRGYRDVKKSQLSWFKRHWDKDFRENTGYAALRLVNFSSVRTRRD